MSFKAILLSIGGMVGIQLSYLLFPDGITHWGLLLIGAFTLGWIAAQVPEKNE